MELTINDSEIIDKSWIDLKHNQKSKIEILINNKRVFVGCISTVDADMETITDIKDQFTYNSWAMQPVEKHKINFSLRCENEGKHKC